MVFWFSTPPDELGQVTSSTVIQALRSKSNPAAPSTMILGRIQLAASLALVRLRTVDGLDVEPHPG
jgi:hypothetical protein